MPGAERLFSVAVLDFEGRGGVAFADTVESELVTAHFRGAPAITVVDPSLAGPGFARGRFRDRYGSPEGLAEVGAVLGVGMARGIGSLNLRTVGTIFTSWVVTLPAGALLSILFFFFFKGLFGA